MIFEEYDSFEDMQAAMQDAEAAANGIVTNTNRQVAYGSYWIRWYGPEQLLIFGYVTPLEETVATEKQLGADAQELKSFIKTENSAYERGYRFGRCYSAIEPTGELGSTHISTMLPISQIEFELAQAAGWKISIQDLWAVKMMDRWNDMIEEQAESIN